MKRTNEESVKDEGGRKKRVRFDPETKDNNAEDKPTVQKAPKRPRREEDEFDILGRRIQQQPTSSTFNNDELLNDDKKHTLDSDEEDEKHDPSKLDIRTVHGQEKSTIEYEGSTKIMPFNLDDEFDEGHYDEEGNFVFDKKKDEIHDEWMDNIDWDSVKQKAGDQWNKMNDEDDENESAPKVDGVAACERILSYLDDKTLVSKDDATINDILKKLNSQKKLTPAEERKRRWEAKKKGVEYKNESSESVNDLTGAVDDLISMGHMEAYSMNRQQLFDLYEKLEIEKEISDREERKRLAAIEAAKKEQESQKAETTQGLISDLMDDDDDEEAMDTEESNKS